MASFPGQLGRASAPPLPNQVQGLAAVVVSAAQVNLSWSAVPLAVTYTVSRNGAPLASGLPTTAFSDTTVTANTTYSYTVQAVNANGTGLASVPAIAATTLPAQVTGLVATVLGPNSISLTWNSIPGVSTYVASRLHLQVTVSSNSFVDSGLVPSTTYTYEVAANNAVGEGPFSSPVSATTQAASGGSIVFKPGIRVRFGGYATMDTLANIKAVTDTLWGPSGLDINNKLMGICVSPTLAQLEGATLGDYSAGFAAIGAIINLLKSYSTPKDLSIFINCAGNGWSPQTGFLPGFCPAYMNNSTYGGGMSEGTTRPFINFWLPNVSNRIVACVAAFNTRFGPDTPTGGIYRWDEIQEISVDANVTSYSPAALLAVWPAFMAGSRAAAPSTLIVTRPTFINPNNGASYVTILREAFNNHISMANEDTGRIDWGTAAYRGLWPGFTTVDHTTANGGNPDWDFHCNVDPAELYQTGNPSAAVPPASIGPGLLYDGAPAHPGIWTAINALKASHVDIFIDSAGGPNVNSRFAHASPPANPTPGPGAGSTAAHPNLIDVLTGNTAYSGVVPANTAMPWTARPPGY